jgi:hypothetical protein
LARWRRLANIGRSWLIRSARKPARKETWSMGRSDPALVFLSGVTRQLYIGAAHLQSELTWFPPWPLRLPRPLLAFLTNYSVEVFVSNAWRLFPKMLGLPH